MDERIIINTRETMANASMKDPNEIMSVYSSLMKESGTDWQTLAAISIVSAELFAKNASPGNEIADIFQAINEMVDDHAAAHRDEITDYCLYTQHRRNWLYDIPSD